MRSEFQLTASQGGWRLIEDICEKFEVFQLTASQGGWQRDDILTHRQQDFNSQPHKEADMRGCGCWECGRIFQLTASQGGWQTTLMERLASFRFQLTASQGGWLRVFALCDDIRYFNSQPHKEADGERTSINVGTDVFQLTASQGGWRLY